MQNVVINLNFAWLDWGIIYKEKAGLPHFPLNQDARGVLHT